MLPVRPLSTKDWTHADLCQNTKLLESNLKSLSLEDSEIVLKLLRVQLTSIQEQINLSKNNLNRPNDWLWKAKAARGRKKQSIAVVCAHIKFIKPKVEREILTQIQREQISAENISLKKKLAKQKAHAARLETERRIWRRLVTERLSREFMLELDKDMTVMLKAELAQNTVAL